jgi:hypothetical protein
MAMEKKEKTMDTAMERKSMAMVTNMERKGMDMITARRVTVMVQGKLTVTTTNTGEITITDLRDTSTSMITHSA